MEINPQDLQNILIYRLKEKNRYADPDNEKCLNPLAISKMKPHNEKISFETPTKGELKKMKDLGVDEMCVIAALADELETIILGTLKVGEYVMNLEIELCQRKEVYDIKISYISAMFD